MIKKMKGIVVLGILMSFGPLYADANGQKSSETEGEKILDSSYSPSVLATVPETKFEVEVVEKDRDVEMLLRAEIDRLKKERADLRKVIEGNLATYDEMAKTSEEQRDRISELETALDSLEDELDLNQRALEMSAAERKSLEDTVADLKDKLEEAWGALADFKAEVIAYRNAIRRVRLHGDTGVQLGYLRKDEETGQSVETIHVVRGSDTAGRTFISYLVPYRNHNGAVVAAMKTLHLHFQRG